MATTIQVSEVTRQLLERVKEKQKAKTFDIVIQTMARNEIKVPVSMRGSLKWRKWNKSRTGSNLV